MPRNDLSSMNEGVYSFNLSAPMTDLEMDQRIDAALNGTFGLVDSDCMINSCPVDTDNPICQALWDRLPDPSIE